MGENFYVLYNTLIWLFCFWVVYPRWKTSFYYTTKGRIDKNTLIFLFILFFAFSLFTFFGGDNARYEEFVTEGYKYYGQGVLDDHEPLYVELSKIADGNFILWKILVYGLALIATYYTIKRLNCNTYTTYLSFILFALLSYGATRAVLAYSVFLLGVTMFASEKKIQKCFGIIISGASITAHSSMILPLVLLPLSLVPLTKKKVIVILLSFPISVVAFNQLSSMLFEYIPALGMAGTKLEVYTDTDLSIIGYNKSFLMDIRYVFDYVTVGLLLFLSIKSDVLKSVPKTIAYVIRISMWLCYCALVINFSKLPNGDIMFQRYFGMIPFFLYITWPFWLRNSEILPKKFFKPYIMLTIADAIIHVFIITYYMIDQ